MSKKHPQFILALHAEAFVGVSSDCDSPEFPINKFLEEAQSYITIRERNHLDNKVYHGENGETWKGDRNYRQIVKYTALCWEETADQPARVAAFRRETTGEERLNGRVGIGFGGHTDLADVVFDSNSVINLKETLEVATLRELYEEVMLTTNGGEEADMEEVFHGCRQIGLLVSDADDVSRLHVGIAQIIVLPAHVSVQARESEGQSTVDPMTLQQLADYENLENWSRQIVPHLGEYLNKRV